MERLAARWDLLPGHPISNAGFIYFSSGIGGSSHLFRVPASGGAVKQITKGERDLSGFSMSAAFDRLAYASTDSTHPSEVFAARIDGTSEKKLSGFNDALIGELSLGQAERILYPSKDGTQIEGWV